MTRMTGLDCAVMCNLINIHTYIHTYILHTYIFLHLLENAHDLRREVRNEYSRFGV